MELINNRWYDERGNSWSAEHNTEEGAQNKSRSNVSCSDCSDCSDCSYCSYCSYCSDCSYCSYCSDCSDCSDCSYCSDCSSCSYCSDCSSCSSCSDCSSCSSCSSCSGCRNFTYDPFRLKVHNIGSKNSDITIYWSCFGDTQVICGRFSGNIYNFLKAVEKTHKNNEHAVRYRNLVDKVFALMEV